MSTTAAIASMLRRDSSIIEELPRSPASIRRSSRSRRADRPVASSRSASTSVARVTGATTSWAMRMPRVDLEDAVAEIDQDHLDLAAIVRVDRARRVEHRDAVPQREAGARPDLALVAGRELQREAGRDQALGPAAQAGSALRRGSRPGGRGRRRRRLHSAAAAGRPCGRRRTPTASSPSAASDHASRAARRAAAPPRPCSASARSRRSSARDEMDRVRRRRPSRRFAARRRSRRSSRSPCWRASRARCSITLLGLGGEADDEARAVLVPVRDGGEDVRVLDQRQRRQAVRRSSSSSRPPRSPPPVGDGGGEDRDVGRQRRSRRPQHFARVSTCTVLTPGGSGMATGPETSVTSAPASAAALRDRVALACRRSGWRCSAPGRSARASARR